MNNIIITDSSLRDGNHSVKHTISLDSIKRYCKIEELQEIMDTSYMLKKIYLDDNDKPLNIMDFIHYNFAIKHPHVAMTKEEMDANFNKKFYIQDLSREDKVKNNSIQLKKDADRVFIKVSSNLDNMKRILRLLSNTNPDRMTADQHD